MSYNLLQPKSLKIGYTRVWYDKRINDPYDWLRDKKWPNVFNKFILKHLEKENTYAKFYTDKFLKFKNDIYQELDELTNWVVEKYLFKISYYCDLEQFIVSTDNKYASYSVDHIGGEEYTIHVLELKNKQETLIEKKYNEPIIFLTDFDQIPQKYKGLFYIFLKMVMLR